MASTYTTNLHLELQGTGDNSGTWGSELNTAVFTILDNALGGAQTFSLSNVDVTVSTTQSQNNAFLLTGTLTGNVNIIFPSIGRMIYVVNNTTGNFTVTLKTASAGVTQTIAQGTGGIYILNATDVYQLVNVDVLKRNVTATITVGYTITPNSLGSISGAFTPNPALGNYQYLTNGGAITWNAPASDCAMQILVTNGASAGAITFSGYTVGSSTGSTLTTTNGNKFLINITRINSVSTYSIYALQ